MEEKIQQISESELELMKIIWSKGGTAMYSEIFDSLEEKGLSWTKNMIITLLSRLIDKKALKIDKIGRRNKYIAIITESGYQASQTMKFVDKLFAGNMQGLVNTLVENEMLTSNDLDELRKQWNAGVQKHE